MNADVTIGLPVYNGEANLRSALDCLLDQDYEDFIILVCDNASTDSTADICFEYASKDARIRIHRHQSNCGAVANFQFALDQADTPFFMWAAADDIRSSDFVKKNRQFLIENPKYVASVCPVRFSDGDFSPIRMGDGLLDGASYCDRVLGYISLLHANGVFYSLFRRDFLARSIIRNRVFIGHDWSTIIRIASYGPLKRLSEGFLVLGHEGVSSTRNRFRLFRKKRISWIFPLYEVSGDALSATRNASLWKRLAVLISLARLNAVAASYQLVLEFDFLYKAAKYIRGR